MARDDDAPENAETTSIAGGQQAWSSVDDPGDARTTPPEGLSADRLPTGDLPADDRPTEQLRTVQQPAGQLPGYRAAGGQPSATDAPGMGPNPRELPPGQPRPGTPPAPLQPPEPVLVASGLGLLTKNGWVFQDINLTLRAATVAAIVGPAGTGRSCLLLALTGRMAANTGTLIVAGHSIRDKPGAIRAVTAVARIGSLTEPERGLTVSQAVTQQCLLEDVNTLIGRARFIEASAALRIAFTPSALVASLVGEQATLFAVALACVRVSAVIVLDDLDRGVSAAAQQVLLDSLIALAKTGPTIVVTTTDRIPVMEADVVLDLTPKEGATTWQLAPPAPPEVAILRQLDPGGRQRDPAVRELYPAHATADPGVPTAEPGVPTAEPGVPTADPGVPTAEPGTPTAEPGTPTAYPGVPTAEPGTPTAEGPTEDSR